MIDSSNIRMTIFLFLLFEKASPTLPGAKICNESLSFVFASGIICLFAALTLTDVLALFGFPIVLKALLGVFARTSQITGGNTRLLDPHLGVGVLLETTGVWLLGGPSAILSRIPIESEPRLVLAAIPVCIEDRGCQGRSSGLEQGLAFLLAHQRAEILYPAFGDLVLLLASAPVFFFCRPGAPSVLLAVQGE